MWEHIKLGELLWHSTLGFFCWGRSLKLYIEIKRELFTFSLPFGSLFYLSSLDFDCNEKLVILFQAYIDELDITKQNALKLHALFIDRNTKDNWFSCCTHPTLKGKSNKITKAFGTSKNTHHLPSISFMMSYIIETGSFSTGSAQQLINFEDSTSKIEYFKRFFNFLHTNLFFEKNNKKKFQHFQK